MGVVPVDWQDDGSPSRGINIFHGARALLIIMGASLYAQTHVLHAHKRAGMA